MCRVALLAIKNFVLTNYLQAFNAGAARRSSESYIGLERLHVKFAERERNLRSGRRVVGDHRLASCQKNAYP